MNTDHPQTSEGDDEGVVGRAQVRSKSQITLPREVRDALHLEQGDVVEFTVTPDGDVKLRAMTTIPTDQRWFWTEEWQAGEREASADIAAGRTRFFESDEEFLAYLHDPDKS